VKEKLKFITDKILFGGENFNELRETCNELYDLFLEIAEIKNLPETKNETILSNGKAISATDAARCVIDFYRTTQFLRGINQAVLQAQKLFPNQTIEILYAGCGPFATLAIPLCTQFSSDEINFTLIDIHQISLDSVCKIVKNSDLENYFTDFIQTDACTYQSSKKFHIAITETMQKSLEKEPQVAVTLNISKQICENGILIPQEITVDVGLADLSKEFTAERNHITLGNILKLNKNTKKLPKVKVKIPDNNLDVILLTKIKVFDSFDLDVYDSGITYPTILFDLKARYGKTEVEFYYQMSETPKFIYEKV
jgi:hypothetical protein